MVYFADAVLGNITAALQDTGKASYHASQHVTNPLITSLITL